MSPSMVGAGAGLLGAVGVLLIVLGLPWRREPTLEDRLAPYLLDVAPAGAVRGYHRPRSSVAVPARADGGTTGLVVKRLLGPLFPAALRGAERISGGSSTLRRRLDQAGSRRNAEQFRAEQVACGLAGSAAGAGIGLLVAAGRGFSLLPVTGLVLVGGLSGVLGRDSLLTAQVRRREQRILGEFPAVAEMLALAVGAGEGAVGALDRVARTARGELTAEIARTVAEARTGLPLVEALGRLAARSSLPSVARFADGFAVAVERGTPLAGVLRAQAQDVRDLSRRRLMELGGRKEIAMMVPVVFLLLPVTVLFAIYPGLAVLDLGG